MTLVHNSVTVGTTATLIAEIPVGNPNTAVQVSNTDSATIFLGDATLSNTGADKGIRLASNGNLQVWLNSGDMLYAVSAAGTSAFAVTVAFSKIVG
jgi:uridine phosphorylase